MDKNQDEPALMYGPLRKAPQYYAGEMYNEHPMNHLDVERNANGSMPGIRNKLARRRIRASFKRKYSTVEQGLQRLRAMKAQAMDVTDNPREGRRLLAKELSIHQVVYVPDQKQLRAMRTEKRKLARAGKRDRVNAAIEKLVDAGA